MAVFNLLDQLCFYRSYHYTTANVILHMIFIPTIFITYICLLAYVNFSKYIPLAVGAQYQDFVDQYILNLGSLGVLVYSAFYILLHPLYGSIFSVILGAGGLLVQRFYDWYPQSQVLKGAFALNCIAWLFQFLGHLFFEHRAPLLLDNLLQPLVLAPYFVFFEIIFYLGFEKDLKAKMDARAQILILEFKKNK